MIVNFPSLHNKILIQVNYEASKKFHAAILGFYNPTSLKDQRSFQWARSWLDEATTQMINSL